VLQRLEGADRPSYWLRSCEYATAMSRHLEAAPRASAALTTAPTSNADDSGPADSALAEHTLGADRDVGKMHRARAAARIDRTLLVNAHSGSVPGDEQKAGPFVGDNGDREHPRVQPMVHTDFRSVDDVGA